MGHFAPDLPLNQSERYEMTEFSEIPVIDITGLTDVPSDDLVAQFRKAYGETGFGYITGHGIDQALIDSVFAASAAFHALPADQKQAFALDSGHRGYIAINTSTDVNSAHAEVTKPNQSASLMMLREDTAHDPDVYLSGPNQWPDLDGFRDLMLRYKTEMSDLGRRLMRLAVLAAGADPEPVLRDGFATPTTWLRLLHYRPTDPLGPDDLFGSAPHNDFGCLTLLAQDGIGGLQVKTPAGNWVDAPKIEGSFVVNVGDMLHRMSNGRLLSTPHRVINRSGRERYSVPFFFDPHVSYDIAPMPGTGTPHYAPINFGDFLRGELEAGYDAHKDAKSV